MADRPGARKNVVGAVRAMYRWAVEREIVKDNPAADIPMTYQSRGGAKPWSVGDLKQFRQRHPFGSDAHMALTLFMFTAARVSDAIALGRANEIQRDGLTWLQWQPGKKGSSKVTIPVLPPLLRAIRAREVEHLSGSYLLTAHGRPWRSSDSFRNCFKRWCVEAGLPDRSPHGIRKAAGHLLAEAGATQHQIMAVHGHSQAQTSEVYTRDVQRSKLAESAVALLAGMEW
ncbi:site-specific integrase [Poseidonocella sp. HB161398]|uniref:tyrosine-type recombinase/integrase n=1 Tax=Poseidonocella sp. HB161398 TaxID=2320855 RepID=UPI001109507A|nr:site-specific integrase [Poseidonocella sp. HB161398]